MGGAIPGQTKADRPSTGRRRWTPKRRMWHANAEYVSGVPRGSGAGRAAGTGRTRTRGSPRTGNGERRRRRGHTRHGSPHSSAGHERRTVLWWRRSTHHECREDDRVGARNFLRRPVLPKLPNRRRRGGDSRSAPFLRALPGIRSAGPTFSGHSSDGHRPTSVRRGRVATPGPASRVLCAGTVPAHPWLSEKRWSRVADRTPVGRDRRTGPPAGMAVITPPAHGSCAAAARGRAAGTAVEAGHSAVPVRRVLIDAHYRRWPRSRDTGVRTGAPSPSPGRGPGGGRWTPSRSWSRPNLFRSSLEVITASRWIGLDWTRTKRGRRGSPHCAAV